VTLTALLQNSWLDLSDPTSKRRKKKRRGKGRKRGKEGVEMGEKERERKVKPPEQKLWLCLVFNHPLSILVLLAANYHH